MAFKPLLEPEAERPKTNYWGPGRFQVVSPLLWLSIYRSRLILQQFMRDQLSITTWLATGALVQSLAFLLVGHIALLPATLYMFYTLASTSFAAAGLKHNSLMDGVIPSKFSSAFPDSQGTYGSKAADSEIVVFHIGFRNNHPLGIFAPGVKQMGEFFQHMVVDLEAHDEEYGLMGATNWLNASARTTQNETLVVAYFKTVEGVHAFAHSEYHLNAWKWWNEHLKNEGWSHMSIYHELYHVPKGNWETIHGNSHVSGLPSSRVKTDDGLWVSPLVDASRGLLKTSSGRMARSGGGDHEKLDLGGEPAYQ